MKDKSLTWYFAYGSNMSEARMSKKGISFFLRVPAKLYGFEIIFNNKGEIAGQAYANLQSVKGSITEGVLYAMPPKDLIRLDFWEKCPKIYERRTYSVRMQDGKPIYAEVYVSKNDFTAEGLKPTKEYLNWILEGKDLLSKKYFAKLSAVEPLD